MWLPFDLSALQPYIFETYLMCNQMCPKVTLTEAGLLQKEN